MKIINDWPSRNELKSAADPPVLAKGDSLYYNFYDYYYLWFYYRLGASVKYHFLDEDNYFNEDN
jgi:hypothetical protein